LPAGEGPVVLRLLLRNLEPLNLAATALAGNLVFAQGYLPGTRLRAALLHWLSAREEKTADALADPLGMQVGTGYFIPKALREPLAALEGLPLPLTLQEPKGGQGQDGQAATADGPPWWARAGSNGDGLGARGERDKLALANLPGDRDER